MYVITCIAYYIICIAYYIACIAYYKICNAYCHCPCHYFLLSTFIQCHDWWSRLASIEGYYLNSRKIQFTLLDYTCLAFLVICIDKLGGYSFLGESDVNLSQCMPIIIHIWPPPPPPPWPSLTTGGNCFLGHRLWIWVSRSVCQCCQGQLLDRLRGIRSWYYCNLFEKQVKVRICFLL